jgi:spore maturation protein CgeB
MPSALLAAEAPDLHAVWRGLGSVERQRDFDLLVIWEANRRYRVRCVERLLPFSPLIVGDPGWKTVLRRAPGAWRRLDGLNYYRDLPRFYPLQAVSFNCTSVHMRGALNQRNFDVPACGAFLLTDWHPRIEEHFEVGREVVCYRDPDDVPGLLERWLADGPGRRAVATAGRRRVLAEHTYAHRMRSLLAEMARIYA